MAAFTDSELDRLYQEWEAVGGRGLSRSRISGAALFSETARARRPDGVLATSGDMVSGRYVLFDLGGNTFVKEHADAGVRLGFVPRAWFLWRHAAERGGPGALYVGPELHRISVRVVQPIEGAAATPYAWRFVPSRLLPYAERKRHGAYFSQPRLEIVAAPGVEVDQSPTSSIGTLQAAAQVVNAVGPTPTRTVSVRRRTDAAVTVRRVQDVALLPGPDGSETHAAEAFGSALSEQRLRSRAPYFHVTHRADGLDVMLFPRSPRGLFPPESPSPLPRPTPTEDAPETWPEWGQRAVRRAGKLIESVAGLPMDTFGPLTIRIRVPLQSATARFTWRVTAGSGYGGGPMWSIEIARTEDVAVDLAEGGFHLQRFGTFVSYAERTVSFGEADNLDAPTGGAIRRQPSAGVPVAWMLTFELVAGFTPIVGELTDLADLAAYSVFGTDKWGQSLSRGEVALVLVGLGTPLVAGAALRVAHRHGRRLLAEMGEAYGHLSRREQGAARALANEVSAVRHAQDVPDDVWTPPAEYQGPGWQQFIGAWILGKLARRLPPQTAFPARGYALSDLVTLNGDGFGVPEIQTAYAAYRRGRIDPLPPRRWLFEQAPREIQAAARTLLDADAYAIETARSVGDFVSAVRREAARTTGSPRSDFGRPWAWDRFSTPETIGDYRWRHGDPIDAPRTVAKDYPPYETARKRAYQNLAYFELQRRLDTELSTPPTADELWRLLQDRGFLSDAGRSASYIDAGHEVSLVELVTMYKTGTAAAETVAYRGRGWAATATKRRSGTSQAREAVQARLELRRRHGDVANVADGHGIRAALGDRASSLPPAGAQPVPRGVEDLTDEDLLKMIERQGSPFRVTVFELEHAEVPQRATSALLEAMEVDESLARRLTLAGDPRNLLFVDPLWHGFLDHHRQIPRAAAEGLTETRAAAEAGHLFDERVANPLARLPTEQLLELRTVLGDPTLRVLDPAKHRQLVDWTDEVVAARGVLEL